MGGGLSEHRRHTESLIRCVVSQSDPVYNMPDSHFNGTHIFQALWLMFTRPCTGINFRRGNLKFFVAPAGFCESTNHSETRRCPDSPNVREVRGLNEEEAMDSSTGEEGEL